MDSKRQPAGCLFGMGRLWLSRQRRIRVIGLKHLIHGGIQARALDGICRLRCRLHRCAGVVPEERLESACNTGTECQRGTFRVVPNAHCLGRDRPRPGSAWCADLEHLTGFELVPAQMVPAFELGHAYRIVVGNRPQAFAGAYGVMARWRG